MKNRWLKNEITSVLNNHIVEYPTPINLGYGWAFGALSGICLVIQIVTGIFLAMHYAANIDIAFNSVEHIMRDVNNGWLIRYLHSNGASMFFVLVYIHMFRGLYYGSYMQPRMNLWISGVIIFFIMILTAFIGYVLPYGQMSLWGATVITNLATSIPLIGDSIVVWLWGGFSVSNATLNRFFSLHYTLPFIIVGLVLLHLVLLHIDGSSNRLGIDTSNDKIPFMPYFVIKKYFELCVFMLLFSILVFYSPNMLGHSDNYIMANSLVTPAHIVPEWYFLTFYAILRAVPHKLIGVLAMVFAILVLCLLPIINTSEIRSNAFKPIGKKVFWIFVAVCLILGWLGQKPVEYPYVLAGQIAAISYFVILLVVMPVLGKLESKMLR